MSLVALALLLTAGPSPEPSSPEAAVRAFVEGDLGKALTLADDCAAHGVHRCDELSQNIRAYWEIHLGFERGTPREDLDKLEALEKTISPGQRSVLDSQARDLTLERALNFQPDDGRVFWSMSHSAPVTQKRFSELLAEAKRATGQLGVFLALNAGDLPGALERARACAARDERCQAFVGVLERYRDVILEAGQSLTDQEAMLGQLQALDRGNSLVVDCSQVARRLAFGLYRQECADSQPEGFCERVKGVAFLGRAARPSGVSKGLTPPVFLSGPEVVYPHEAIAAKVAGTVVLQCDLKEDGSVHDCVVLKSIPLLDRAAIEAVEQRRFLPVTFDGKPVAVKYVFNIRFGLPEAHFPEG